ncbi:transmembrane protein 109-like [Rhincodon typus]|uniref:transmembrane protein 109-like n=1 Tax=Rhincodon typus TaxID=259920 RepID=UPI00202EF893|nr:transmembrane protein 109-like [Rhincodon typus]
MKEQPPDPVDPVVPGSTGSQCPTWKTVGAAPFHSEDSGGHQEATTLLHYWQVAINSITAVVNLVAELCSDLLDALGIEGGELDTDRETLRRALSWGLAALLIYLILLAVLRLLAYLAGRLLWLVKLGLFFLAAGYVVATCDDEKRRNTLLLGLGALYLLLGRLPLPFVGSCCTPNQHQHQHRLESKVTALEHQLAEMERKVHQRKLYDYDYD